jgi:ABC-type uncharacterized transport system involved in gliding motility auxiliary subunit
MDVRDAMMETLVAVSYANVILLFSYRKMQMVKKARQEHVIKVKNAHYRQHMLLTSGLQKHQQSVTSVNTVLLDVHPAMVDTHIGAIAACQIIHICIWFQARVMLPNVVNLNVTTDLEKLQLCLTNFQLSSPIILNMLILQQKLIEF